MNWLIPALLSAFFAALTSIFAKLGIKDISSNLATGIRTFVILTFIWIVVFSEGSFKQIGTMSKTTLFYILISGLTAAVSLMFYFRALQVGQASQVSPIDKLSLLLTVLLATFFLGEKLTAYKLVGALLMSTGAILISLSR